MTISANVPTIAQNKTFDVSFSGLPQPDPLDWIWIGPKGGNANGSNYGYGYSYTKGEVNGQRKMTVFTIGEGAPQPSLIGPTDLVLYNDDGYNEVERFPGPEIVQFKPTIALGLNGTTIKLGDPVLATWTTSDVTDGCWDALALVPSGQDVDKFLGIGLGTDPTKQGYWQLTKYQKSGTMSLRPPKGKFSVGQTLDLVYVVCGSPVASKKRELHRVTGALKLA